MPRLLTAVLFTFSFIGMPLCSQDTARPATPISEQNDLAHRNLDIHWPKGRTPADAQAFSHNEAAIDASCERIFKYLGNPQTWPTYLVFAKDVQQEGAGPLAIGSRFRWIIFGKTIESEIAEFEPARRMAWTNVQSQFYQTWLLQPQGQGCHVTTEEVGFGPVAAHRTATGDVATHRAHDLWLASLRWIAEGDTSSK